MRKSKRTSRSSRRSTAAGGGLSGIAQAAGSALLGSGSKRSSGGHKRNRGPAYWANKVLTEKLKQKYRKIKYGSAYR